MLEATSGKKGFDVIKPQKQYSNATAISPKLPEIEPRPEPPRQE